MSGTHPQRSLLAAASLLALGASSACTVDATEADIELANRCTEAAAAVAECGGEVTEEFYTACEHDPTPESIAVVEDMAAAQCDASAMQMGKADGWGETIFVSACTPTMHLGYLTNRWRNGEGRRLRARDRDALRPHFGSLVDRVSVHYDAKINTRYEVAGHELQYGNYTAQAYGIDVYITEPYRPGDNRQLALVAHEIQHSRQFQRAGGMHQSLKNYCREYYRGGLSYENNALEIEAYEVQARILRCLRSGDCS